MPGNPAPHQDRSKYKRLIVIKSRSSASFIQLSISFLSNRQNRNHSHPAYWWFPEYADRVINTLSPQLECHPPPGCFCRRHFQSRQEPSRVSPHLLRAILGSRLSPYWHLTKVNLPNGTLREKSPCFRRKSATPKNLLYRKVQE